MFRRTSLVFALVAAAGCRYDPQRPQGDAEVADIGAPADTGSDMARGEAGAVLDSSAAQPSRGTPLDAPAFDAALDAFTRDAPVADRPSTPETAAPDTAASPDLSGSRTVDGACGTCTPGARDNCCPPGCTRDTDPDCASRCGDGVREENETCDPVSECLQQHQSCVSDKDTVRNRLGDPSACTFVCSSAPRECGRTDGFCPTSCRWPVDQDCPRPPGEPCGENADCMSQICADGRCCRTTCASCYGCTGPGGTCEPIATGKPDEEPAGTCANTRACDGAGTCRLRAGQTCSGHADCLSGLCKGGRCCMSADCTGVCSRCDGSGSCLVAGLTCATDLDRMSCSGARYCDSVGACVTKRADGSPGGPCEATSCLSGQLDRGLCCGTGHRCSAVTVGKRDCATKLDGSLWCWKDDRAGAAKVPLDGVAEVATGGVHVCARLVDGSVHCWAEPGGSEIPKAVTALGTSVTRIAVGTSHACAVKDDGTLWCWGDNSSLQLGDGGTSMRRDVPYNVSALGNDVTSVAAGSSHTCAGKRDGILWCWGYNELGQVGDGTSMRRPSPVQVTMLGSAVKDVFAGGVRTCAIKADGSLWCWGGEIVGDGARDTRFAPTRVELGGPALRVGLGSYNACALRTDGALHCWGTNDNGQVGDGTTIDRLAPVPVTSLGNTVVDVSVHSYPAHACARTKDGGLWCWGYNLNGELGVVTSDPVVSRPLQVPGF